MKNLLRVLFFAFIAISVTACSDMSKQDVGTLTGAAVGGLVGSRFGGGSGQVAAAAGGAIIGGFLGNQIGKSMDKSDQTQMQQAINKNRTGTGSTWVNPDTHTEYTVTPTKTFEVKRGKRKQYCREFTTTAEIAGKQQEMYGTACRKPDGTWEVVKSAQ